MIFQNRRKVAILLFLAHNLQPPKQRFFYYPLLWWIELYQIELNDEFEANRELIENSRKGKNIPVYFYVKYLNQQGYLFPRAIMSAHANGKLTYGEMCRTLNVNSKHIGDIERAVMFT